MKIRKLLEGLYQELKAYNEHMAEVKAKEEEEERRRENNIDRWIIKRLKEKNINNLPDNTVRVACFGFDWAQKEVCDALDYHSFADLLAAYRQQIGGVAA